MNIDEYKLFGFNLYDKFSKTVKQLLSESIEQDRYYHLNQIQNRAKTIESLTHRLNEINEIASTNIENHRKDLAGCRVIFYTNHDVARFTSSDTLTSLYDVVWGRSKIHQPIPSDEKTSKLFQSFNYVVRLKAAQTSLMEYSEFEGLVCEIQIQTILNHAWAEMAHDTIYKRPEFLGKGTPEIKQIEERLCEVMREHLLPAGYLFQKIASEVQLLTDGKALLDSGLLDAIVYAADNNDRHTALMRLKKDVLPVYDNVHAIAPDLLGKLKEAWSRAEHTETVPFKGTLGKISGYAPQKVTAQIANIITLCRYIEPRKTYEFVRDLYIDTSSNASKTQLLKIAEDLARHNSKIWKQYGPAIPVILAEELEKENDVLTFAPLAITISKEILDSDVEGTTEGYNTITFSRGRVGYSKNLEDARKTVINVIANYAKALIDDDSMFCDAIECLMSAGKMPYNSEVSPELATMIYTDLTYVIERISRLAMELSFNCRQNIESKLLIIWQVHQSVRQEVRSSPIVCNTHKQFVENTLELRSMLNADEEYAAFKTIIGSQAVFPHIWEEESEDWEHAQEVLRQEQERLADQITPQNWSQWKSLLATAAKAESKDRITSPQFIQFLSFLVKRQPDLVLDLLRDWDTMPAWMIPPISGLLLEGNEQSDVEILFNEWLDGNQYTQEIAGAIARSNCVKVSTVQKTVACSVENRNQEACKWLIQGAICHFKGNPDFWQEQVFFPCLKVLETDCINQWIHEFWWMLGQESLVAKFNTDQTQRLLEQIVDIPRIDREIDRVLAIIANNHWKLVLNWLGERLKRAKQVSSLDYSPIPFSFREVGKVFQTHPKDLVAAMREWWDSDDTNRLWKISHFLSATYPNLGDPLLNELLTRVKSGDSSDLKFIASSLRGFKVRKEMLPLLREILASESVNDEIENMIDVILRETGMVRGAFGVAQAFQAKADMLRSWFKDSNDRVVAFAKREVHVFEQDVARENRLVSERIAMRKLDFDEPLDKSSPPAGIE